MDKEKGRATIVAVIIVAVIVIAAVASMALIQRDVTVSTEGDGEVTFEGSTKVNGIGTLIIDITPAEGMTASVYLDGELVSSNCDSYTYKGSMLDFSSHAIVIVFSPATSNEDHTLTVKFNDGGKVSPRGTNNYTEGSKQTVTITPDEGYAVSDVLLDGVSTGPVTSLEVIMNHDHTVEVVFAVSDQKAEYTITASTGNGGSITPSGQIKVEGGADQTFTIKANSNYRVSQVLIDGIVTSVSGGSYTFKNVSGDHTISVTFRYTGGGGTVTPVTLQSIEISAEPRTGYLVGETFDCEGMVVTAKYSDGTSKTVTDYTISPDSELSLDDSKITVTYQGKTASITITVVEETTLNGIKVTTNPSKMHYFDDQEFNPEGMVISGIYSNGVEIPLLKDNYNITAVDDTVTVTHKEITTTLTITRDLKVNDLNELQYFAKKVNEGKDYSGKTVELESDIDLDDVDWIPIGTKTSELGISTTTDAAPMFRGTFDGNNHTISNLNISQPNVKNVGFFSKIEDGMIKNLNVTNAKVIGGSSVGILAGGYTVKVDNCHIKGLVTIEGNYKVGGLLGETYGSVTNCTINAEEGSYVKGEFLNAANNREGDNVGGAIGYGCEGKITHDNIRINGLNVTGTRKVGGIIGYLNYGVTLTNSSFSNGDVKSNATNDYSASNKIYIGGIVGEFSGNSEEDGSTISNCSVSEVMVEGPDRSTLGEIYGGTRNNSNMLTSINNVPYKVMVFDQDTVRISTPQDLVDLAERVNDGDTYENKFVVLVDNVNMKEIEWIPIGCSVGNYPSNSFKGTFDGADHTISNLKSSPKRAINDDTNAADGLFGALCGFVKNLNIDRVEITGTHYVGAIAGYSSGNGSVIENCHVTNATLKSIPVKPNGSDLYDNGDKVGGIIGYMVSKDKVLNCSVKNSTITGFRNIGGIVGYSAGEVKHCSIDEVSLHQSSVNAYASSSIGNDVIGNIVGTEANGFEGTENTGDATIIQSFNIHGVKQTNANAYDSSKSYIEIGDADGLLFVMQNYSQISERLSNNVASQNLVYLFQWTVKITENIDFKNAKLSPIPYSYGALDGQNHTISNVTITENGNIDTVDYVYVGLFEKLGQVNDLTVKNIHVSATSPKAFTGTVAGFTNGSWSNVHVDGFSVSAKGTGSYTGGLVGTCYGSKTNCTVSNGEIEGGKNVGGFAGYVCEEKGTLTLSDCHVSKVSIDAYERITSIGSFAGSINNQNSTIILTNCSSNATGTNVPSDRMYGYLPGGTVTINGSNVGMTSTIRTVS